MRLFTALWLPHEQAGHLEAAVDSAREGKLAETTGGLRKFRFVPRRQWHLTLCFHGEVADPQGLGDRLDRRLRRLGRSASGLTPPRLRLAGAGAFRGVLWIGVEPATDSDAAALGALVRAAGAHPGSYRAHMTVARWAGGRAPESLRGLFAEYAGPWWSADEVALVRSEPGQGPPTYTTMHSAAVARVAGEQGGFQSP